jgi:arylsulfatase A-like enzyme
MGVARSGLTTRNNDVRMYQQRWGNYSLGIQGEGLPSGKPTIPLLLKKCGYATKKVGKNHFGGGDASHAWHASSTVRSEPAVSGFVGSGANGVDSRERADAGRVARLGPLARPDLLDPRQVSIPRQVFASTLRRVALERRQTVCRKSCMSMRPPPPWAAIPP